MSEIVVAWRQNLKQVMMVELATLRGVTTLNGGVASAWGRSPAWGRRVVGV